MADPRINTILSFATKGIGGVKNDVKSVVDGVDGATSAVSKLSQKLSSIQKGVAFNSVVQAAGAVKGAFDAVSDVVGGAVNALWDLAYSQAAVADRIGKTSALMGMQAQELQALRSAGQHVGMSIELVDSALQKFSVNTGRAAAGEKQQLDVFNALGVSLRNSDGSIRTQTELLLDAADAYSKLTDSADRNRVSQELFGRSAIQMSALLQDGSAGIRSAVELFERTGAGYTATETKQAAAFNDQLQTMQEYIGGVRKDLFFAVVPAFTKLFDSVSSFVSENRDEIKDIASTISKQLPSALDDIAAVVPVVFSGVSAVASAVASVVDFTGPWVPILGAAGALLGGAILTAVGAIGVAVSSVGAAFGGAVVAAAPIVGIVAAAGVGIAAWSKAIYEVYQNWDMLKSFVVDDVYPAFISGIHQFANSAIDVFAGIADMVASIPVIGDAIAGGSGDWWRSQKFDVGAPQSFDDVPAASMNQAQVTGAPAVTSSSLTVDFKGVPRGTKITPAQNFEFGNFDWSAGYAFGE